MYEGSLCHAKFWISLTNQLIACVASVPVQAERNIGPQEGVFAFRTRGKWGESKKDEGGGWGRGKKETLARKPLYSEKPVRPRTGLLIGAAWFIWLIGWIWRYHIKRPNWKRGTCGRFWIVCLSEVLLELNETGMGFSLKKEQESAMSHIFNGKDVMAILPTGFAKSLIFQLFVTMCGVRSKRQRGICFSGIIVISLLQGIIQSIIVRLGR